MNDKDEQIPPSVQVITRTPDDRWKPGKLRQSEAVAYANTVLPIHARHAAGCKVCFFGPWGDKPHQGQIPCPICFCAIPCSDDCIYLSPCCCGIPVVFPFIICAGTGQNGDRGAGDSFITSGEGGDHCHWIVVDKESGMFNVYTGDSFANEMPACSCVPITSAHRVHIRPLSLNPISKELTLSHAADQ